MHSGRDRRYGYWRERLVRRSATAPWCLLVVALAAALALGGCDLGGGPSAGTPQSTAVKLNQIPWCDRPFISFQDDSTTARTTISSWSSVKDQLGFTPYLPVTLPKGTCLALVGGSIHDPIFGGHFDITYNLPQSGSLSFSEAPKRDNLGSSVQCVVSAQQPEATQPAVTPTPGQPTATPLPPKTEVCLGVIENTSVTLAARQSASDLQTLFKSLKPGQDWQPAAADAPTATATKSA